MNLKFILCNRVTERLNLGRAEYTVSKTEAVILLFCPPHHLPLSIDQSDQRQGRVIQLLRTLVVLEEDPGSIPSNQVVPYEL